MTTDGVELIRIEGLGEIEPGDNLGAAIAAAAELRDGDVVAVAQKVVSKSEGRVIELGSVEPGPEARRLAGKTGKNPALVELILAESERVVRAGEGALIVETRSGLICANAGIDSSNAGAAGVVVLLPADPDRSARRIRAALGAGVGVVVTDSFGRPWRLGQTDVAIGCAGLAPLDDRRGGRDRDGRELTATEIAVADQIAAAADLARGKADGVPAVIVRGLGRYLTADDGPGAAALRRPAERDLFR